MKWPRAKSLGKFETQSAVTRAVGTGTRCPPSSQLNRSLKGWFRYFKHSHKITFPTLDSWIRMRLRSILRCRQGARVGDAERTIIAGPMLSLRNKGCSPWHGPCCRRSILRKVTH